MMIGGSTLLCVRAARRQTTTRRSSWTPGSRHVIQPTVRGGVTATGTGLSSLVRVSAGSRLGPSMGVKRISSLVALPVARRASCRRLPRTTTAKRLSTSEAGTAAEPTSEETAQQLSQLLEQPVALESFITKELTASQRQAVQRLLQNSDVMDLGVPQPSVHSLRLVAMNTAIPFVGFGLMDNMM